MTVRGLLVGAFRRRPPCLTCNMAMMPFPPGDMTEIVEKGYGRFTCRRHGGIWDFRWRDGRWEWYSKDSAGSLVEHAIEKVAWLREGQGIINYQDKQ